MNRTDTTPPPPTAADRTGVRARAEAVLRRLVGRPDAALRDDQWAAVEALAVDGRRALVVQRTGWGKSAVYFVATALLREAGAGPTVIVSPLLALMRNQIDAASRAGVAARTLNSGNTEEWDTVREEVRAGAVDILLVSPERLNNPDFRDNVLPHLAATAGLLVVDEAHCISDWGHDFRPDYRRLRTVLAELRPGVPVLATTATANARVTADIAEQLGTAASGSALVLRGPLDRESLRLGVVPLPDAPHRLAWLADHLGTLPGSGIVYTLTVSAAEEVAAFLRQAGFPVASYSGRTEHAERLAAEDDLLNNRVKALVATSALGMGFDKPDLGFVVHLGAPQSPIAYYQQVGRAGRGVDRAEVLLLPGLEDEAIWEYFASLAFPAEERVRQTLEVLAAEGRPLSTGVLEARVELRRNRLETMLKVLDVDGAVRRVRGGWESTGAPWEYDAERYARVAAERAAEQQAMRNYTATGGCRMEYLRHRLDDESAAPCGRCDNCTGSPAPTGVSAESLNAARSALGRPGAVVEPRSMWPTGLPAVGLSLKGRIPERERVLPGRVLGRLSDIGWGTRLRPLFAPGSSDGPVPEEAVDGLVRVLADWARDTGPWSGGPGRPEWVVTVASGSRPQLVSSLGDRIAAIGRIPVLGAIEYDARSGPPPAPRSNSARRLLSLHHAFLLPEPIQQALAARPGPVLLVDDLVDSGWTMAVAGRMLRRAGATAVLPVALAAQG